MSVSQPAAVNPALLASKIESLTSTEHAEIFRMLQCKGGDPKPYTHNQNGVFYNLNDLDEETLKRVSSFVDYCVHNSTLLQEYDKNLLQQRHDPTVPHGPAAAPVPPTTSMTMSMTTAPSTSSSTSTTKSTHPPKDSAAVLGDSAKFLQMRKKLNKPRWLPFYTQDESVA